MVAPAPSTFANSDADDEADGPSTPVWLFSNGARARLTKAGWCGAGPVGFGSVCRGASTAVHTRHARHTFTHTHSTRVTHIVSHTHTHSPAFWRK